MLPHFFDPFAEGPDPQRALEEGEPACSVVESACVHEGVPLHPCSQLWLHPEPMPLEMGGRLAPCQRAEAETGEREAADALSEPERLVPISRASGKAMRHVDPVILWGVWPGDEPIEELLAELD